ncbi:MAG: ribosome recycling factor [Chloroflexi bacterium]|nr:ribosome recycling factor [Chloroflexota bacterium]
MLDEINSKTKVKMQNAIGALKKELSTLRTGRANPAMVEHVPVDYYGNPTPLNQLANISVPEAKLIVINPWDKQTLSAIEKAILKANLGFTPINDGSLIRLNVPQLTEERRREIIKLAKTRVETTRVEIRNIRRVSVDDLRKLEKEKTLSEDDLKRGTDQLQKLTDVFIVEADKIAKEKEAELVQV